MNYLMGLDVGTTGIKILLVDERGRLKAVQTEEYPLLTPRPGWAEQDPASWWTAAVQGIRNILKKSRTAGKNVAGLGLTGQMHGAVFLDKENRILHPAILWCDQRTAQECREITDIIGEKRVLEITCNPVLTGFQAPKIVWLRKHKPDTYRKVRKVLLPKDYVRLCLTDSFATDVSDASGTSLFDVRGRAWSEEILKGLNLAPDILPEAFESTEITGRLSREAGRLTGLQPGTPVIAGGGDQAAGGVGNGIVEEGLVSVTIGTSGVVFAHAEKVAVDPRGRLHTFCHAVPDKWHLMGVTLSAGGSLRWFRDNFVRQPYPVLTRQAERVPAGCEGLLFLPYLTGERCPYPDPNARGVFFGISLKHTTGHFVRAILEGVTFSLKDCVEIMKEAGLPLGRKFRASGGGAKSDFWCRMQADIFNRKMVRLSSQEGPAYGAAILAGVGLKMYEDVPSACRKLLKEQAAFTPASKNVTIYQRIYPRYRNLYAVLKDSFEKSSES